MGVCGQEELTLPLPLPLTLSLTLTLTLTLTPALTLARYAGKKSSGRPFLPKEELHYLAGGQKDCHAVHVHYALNRLRRLDNLTASGTVHYVLHLMDLDHYCWRRLGVGVGVGVRILTLTLTLT